MINVEKIKRYEFVGKYNNDKYKFTGTVKEIYDYLESTIWQSDVIEWLVNNDKLKLSELSKIELDVYKYSIKTYSQLQNDDSYSDDSIDDNSLMMFDEKIACLFDDLDDEELMDIILCVVDSGDFYEVDWNGHYMKHLEEWEHELNKSVEWFNKHNHYPTEINKRLFFTDCYSSNWSDDYYDLEFQFKSLDDNQLEKLCEFIKCL